MGFRDRQTWMGSGDPTGGQGSVALLTLRRWVFILVGHLYNLCISSSPLCRTVLICKTNIMILPILDVMG